MGDRYMQYPSVPHWFQKVEQYKKRQFLQVWDSIFGGPPLGESDESPVMCSQALAAARYSRIAAFCIPKTRRENTMMALPGRGVESMSRIPKILVTPFRVSATSLEYRLECRHDACEWSDLAEDDADLDDMIYQHITWHEEGMQE